MRRRSPARPWRSGVARDRILQIDTARDTEEETLALRTLAGDAPVALVTSAWHMPRAAALAHHARLNVVPCPADFTAAPAAEDHLADYLGWDVEALHRSSWAIRERVGYLWIWFRGKT